MELLKRTISFRRKKKENKPMQWLDDENSVRMGTCSYNVKYLGRVEVQESRGVHVCEQAIQALLNQKRKHIKAVLYISGDALRVVDEINKGLIVDQTIERVSFCAPDRYHEKGFAYICRDNATRRWLCHCFLAIKETGERLSHSVGCAFHVCLEQKQKHDRECEITNEYAQNDTSFTRIGSFRTTSITERILDPQSVILIEPISYSSEQNTSVIERPRPKGNNSDTIIRSMSMRSNDSNQIIKNVIKRRSSLRPSVLSPIHETKYNDTNLLEDVKSITTTTTTTNEFSKLSLFDSTNTNFNRISIPITKSSINSLSNFQRITPRYRNTTTTKSSSSTTVNDLFNSNLNIIDQNNHTINQFSSYGYSITAQKQSSNRNL